MLSSNIITRKLLRRGGRKTTPSEFQRKVAKNKSQEKKVPKNGFCPFFLFPFKGRKILSRTFASFAFAY